MPGFDINRLLEEDEAVKGMDVPYRFGKAFDVNYSLSDGIWTKVDSGMVWLMKVTSSGAYSINFIFNKLYLPEGSGLYLYSDDGSMVYGPVTSKQNLESGVFLTDIIKGESAIMYLYVPENKKEDARLTISRIVHGYKNLYAGLFESGKGLGDSGDCEKDVECYSDWDNESKAVALVLLANGDELCSGSLLNNTAQNFRAYFLTAFHCADCDPKDGTISSDEEYDTENWMFRFHYKKTECDGSEVATYFTYTQDEIRAAWNTTDFILVEMQESPLFNQKLSFLGWDNSGDAPNEAICIHHPSGDVMKISFDDESPTSEFNNTHWLVDTWDIGNTEPGSSGSPLFNQNDRVVGQDHMGDLIAPICHEEKGTYFGKFSNSWTGDSTNTTRLSNWLDPCGTGVSTLNTIPSAYISGPDNVCTSNSTFTLHNKPASTSVTWSVSPGNRVTPSSGNGTNATFHGSCSNIGNAEITFTLSNACGNDTEISKDFVAAGPDPFDVELDVFTSDGDHANKYGGTWVLCPNSIYHIYLINNSSCSTSGYKWTLPPSLTKNYTYNNMISVNTNSNPGGNIIVKAQTCCSDCGSNVQILSDYVGTDYSCGYGYMSFTPNPTAGETTLELKTDNIKNITEGDIWKAEIFNQKMVMIHKTKRLQDKKYTINTSGWENGIYYVRVNIIDKGIVLSGKFVVER